MANLIIISYRYFIGLPRRTTSVDVKGNKAFNIAENSNNDGYQCKLALMVHDFFLSNVFWC